MRRAFARLAWQLIAPVLLITPTTSAAIVTDQPVHGDMIVEATIGDATTLIPLLASDTASSAVTGLVFNGLVKYDQDLHVVGDLAEGWDVSDDGLTITFRLRRNVRWHDGRPFTAADVLFTYQRLIDPAVKTPYSGDFEKVASVETPDDYTVRVRYKEPFAPGLVSWGMGIIPKHLLEHDDLNHTTFGRAPVGTGPYTFRRWKTGESIELAANPDYFEGRPHIDRYYFRIIPDSSTVFLELLTGGVDSWGLTALQYARQTQTPRFTTQFRTYRYPSFGYTYIGYNLADPRFSDARVRWALNYAIDKEEIVRGVRFGLGKVTTGPFATESWAYNDTIQPAPYDPARAKALLAEAGWRDTDGDGWLDRYGRPFEFTIITNQGNDERKAIAEIVQRRLQAVGIKVKIKILEWSVMVHEFIDKRRFEAVLLGWSLGREPDCYEIWHSSQTKEGQFNFLGYHNDEVDRLLVDGRRTFDQAQREAIYHRIHALIYQDQPCTFLYVPDALPTVHRRFHGIVQAPAGIGWDFIHWYVPLAEQKYTR